MAIWNVYSSATDATELNSLIRHIYIFGSHSRQLFNLHLFTALGFPLRPHHNCIAPFRCTNRLPCTPRKTPYPFALNRSVQGQHRLPQVSGSANHHRIQRRRFSARRDRPRTFCLARSNHRPHERSSPCKFLRRN